MQPGPYATQYPYPGSYQTTPPPQDVNGSPTSTIAYPAQPSSPNSFQLNPVQTAPYLIAQPSSYQYATTTTPVGTHIVTGDGSIKDNEYKEDGSGRAYENGTPMGMTAAVTASGTLDSSQTTMVTTHPQPMQYHMVSGNGSEMLSIHNTHYAPYTYVIPEHHVPMDQSGHVSQGTQQVGETTMTSSLETYEHSKTPVSTGAVESHGSPVHVQFEGQSGSPEHHHYAQQPIVSQSTDTAYVTVPSADAVSTLHPIG